MLRRDGILPTKWGKDIFASRMADLVKKHFKLGMTEESELPAALRRSDGQGGLMSKGPGVMRPKGITKSTKQGLSRVTSSICM